MRPFVLCLLIVGLVGCTAADVGDVAESVESEATHVGPAEGFQTAGNFDPDDVASMHESRDEWVAAFAAGDWEALGFVFADDAVMTLPDAVSMLTAEELFEHYSAELIFDESSERFITDGGDPRKMTNLPWVSYYGDYTLSLTPKAGGEILVSTDRFMTRFRRQPDLSLEVARGPAVGDSAPLFALNDMRAGTEVQLAALKGERPIVLIFGSYT